MAQFFQNSLRNLFTLLVYPGQLLITLDSIDVSNLIIHHTHTNLIDNHLVQNDIASNLTITLDNL
jgi:hypothetical protein